MTSVLPRAFRVLGWLLYPGGALLGFRLLWEAMLLTRERGPQMVGFSLMHTGGPEATAPLGRPFDLRSEMPHALVSPSRAGIKGETKGRS